MFCDILFVEGGVYMTEQQIHDLALAYAQTKLKAYQKDMEDVIDYQPQSNNFDDIKHLVDAYNYALKELKTKF